MLGRFLLGLVADLVLGSTKSMRRSFDAEMGRYFEQRGYQPPSPTHSSAP
jgi:hypothetical protein